MTKPAYLQRDAHANGRDRWMISYLDVLTILLILFVALAAHLQSAPKIADSKKPDAPVQDMPVRDAPVPVASVLTAAAPFPAPNAGLASIEHDLEGHGLDVQLESRGVVVSLPQALLFRPGDDRINADALETLSAMGQVLRGIPNHVSLVGHADTIPIHNRRFGSNWELAAARSLRLLELLSTRYGIDESRLSVESYGSYDPKSTNATPDGRAINRRVEVVIRDAAPRDRQ